MADTLGAIFGSGQSTDTETRADPTSQALNNLRRQQLESIFSGQSEFMQGGGDAYTPSQRVEQLQDYGMRALQSFDNYEQRGRDYLTQARTEGQQALSDAYGRGQADVGTAYNQARASNYQGYQTAQAGNQAAYAQGRQNVRGAYDTARATNVAARDEARTSAQQARDEALGISERAYNRIYGQVMDTTGNYISQVATPRIQQQMALMGLESSGAVGSNVARATAEYGGQLLQPVMQEYQAGQTDIAQDYTAQLSQAMNTYQQAESAANTQYQQGETSLGNTYLGNEGNLGQTYLGNEGNLGSQYTGQMGALANTYTNNVGAGERNYLSNMNQFQSNLPNAWTQQVNAATGLQGLMDYQRQLQESNLNRRQGLYQTALTGIPYTPGSTSSQNQSSQPLFNWFGQG